MLNFNFLSQVTFTFYFTITLDSANLRVIQEYFERFLGNFCICAPPPHPTNILHFDFKAWKFMVSVWWLKTIRWRGAIDRFRRGILLDLPGNEYQSKSEIGFIQTALTSNTYLFSCFTCVSLCLHCQLDERYSLCVSFVASHDFPWIAIGWGAEGHWWRWWSILLNFCNSPSKQCTLENSRD